MINVHNRLFLVNDWKRGCWKGAVPSSLKQLKENCKEDSGCEIHADDAPVVAKERASGGDLLAGP